MEKLIIEQLKQGNEDAFKYIYKQHYVLLCRFANQMLADAALAEEIVDDAIFYLWEHRSDIEIEYSIRAYLMRAVRNRCLNELNSLRRREELLVSSFFLPENSILLFHSGAAARTRRTKERIQICSAAFHCKRGSKFSGSTHRVLCVLPLVSASEATSYTCLR